MNIPASFIKPTPNTFKFVNFSELILPINQDNIIAATTATAIPPTTHPHPLITAKPTATAAVIESCTSIKAKPALFLVGLVAFPSWTSVA